MKVELIDTNLLVCYHVYLKRVKIIILSVKVINEVMNEATLACQSKIKSLAFRFFNPLALKHLTVVSYFAALFHDLLER